MPLSSDLLTPIPGSNPSGTDLRYDPVRDKIKEARREEMEAPQGAWKTTVKTAEWGVVVKLATEAISKKSKDLQFAVWLVDAQVRIEGLKALAPSFDFIAGLLENFWDTLYPEIEDGDLEERAGPISWLGLKLEEPLRLLPITSSGLSWSHYKESRTVGYENEAIAQNRAEQRNQLIAEGKISGEQWDEAVDGTSKTYAENLQESITKALESLERLSHDCDERFGDIGVSFLRTRGAIDEIALLVRGFVLKKGGPTVATQPVPVDEPAAVPEPSYSPPPAPPPASQPKPVAAPASSGGSLTPTDMADVELRLAAICRFLEQKDTYDISPYLILRGFRFGQLRYNGPDKIDVRMLEGPPSEIRAELKRLYVEQNWEALAEASQRAMSLPCGRAWLDLQRYAVRSLENRGDWWCFVAQAVRSEVRAMLTDMPALLDMTLMDDTPVANADTRKWIEEEVMKGVALPAPVAQVVVPSSAPPPAPVAIVEAPAAQLNNAAVDDDTDTTFVEAVAAARMGRVGDALDALSQQLGRELSGRGRFIRRVQMAHVLMVAKASRVAYPILEELATEIEKKSLELWEDRAALAYPLSLLLDCLESNPADESSNGTAERAMLYARICRLDPRRAMARTNEGRAN